MALTCKFVDTIVASPTTRLDLTASPYSVLVKPDFTPPNLRRSVVSSILRDGDEIPASAYENRVLTIRLFIDATSADTLATALRDLHRELDRPRNVLQYANDQTNPVFFRTFRSPDYKLELDDADSSRVFVTLSIIAEPFAYGLKETPTSAVTVNNDPAAATNPMYVDVTGVLGDVATPAQVTVTGTGGQTQLLAVRRHGTPSNATWFRQAEALASLGADTSLPGADAAMSGAGSNYVRTTFATTTTMAQRMSGVFPTGASPLPVDQRGTYRLLGRFRKSVAGDTIKVQIRSQLPDITFDTTTLPLVAGPFIVDLGLLSLPLGSDAIYDGFTGSEVTFPAPTLDIYAERTAGSGNLDTDWLLLVPADEELVIATGVPGTLIYDGPMDSLRTNVAFTLQGTAGTIPKLSPNQTNRLFVVGKVSQSESTSDTVTVTVSYWPRYLYVRA